MGVNVKWKNTKGIKNVIQKIQLIVIETFTVLLSKMQEFQNQIISRAGKENDTQILSY